MIYRKMRSEEPRMMLEFLLCTGGWVGCPELGNQVEEQVGEGR